MAFTAGVKRPSQQSTGSGNFQQNMYDRLVTVLSYNAEQKLMYVEEDGTHKKYEVFVNHDNYLRGEESIRNNPKLDVASIKWMGHDINKKMEKAIPPGKKVILQKSKVLKKDNGEGFAKTEVARIVGVPNAEPDKTFTGIFTVTARLDENRHKRIGRVQHWNENGIDINDSDAIGALEKEITDSAAQYGKTIGDAKVTLPTIGVQFRALMKTDRTNDVGPVYEVVDTSLPFDWISVSDESGKSTNSHPLNGEEMVAMAEGYVEYISTKEEFQGHLDDMKIEICPFRSYPASHNEQLQLTSGEPEKDKNAEKNPLYQLSHKISYIDMAQSEKIQGRNYAVRGIVQISPNKYEKVNGQLTEIPSYWVSNLHTNHTKGHIHALIRTSDGLKTEPHENLKFIKDLTSENTYKNQSDASGAGKSAPESDSERAPTQSSAPTEAQQRVVNGSLGSDDDDFDPFNDSPSTPAAEPVKAEPEKPKLKFGFGKKQ